MERFVYAVHNISFSLFLHNFVCKFLSIFILFWVSHYKVNLAKKIIKHHKHVAYILLIYVPWWTVEFPTSLVHVSSSDNTVKIGQVFLDIQYRVNNISVHYTQKLKNLLYYIGICLFFFTEFWNKFIIFPIFWEKKNPH